MASLLMSFATTAERLFFILSACLQNATESRHGF
jgi:hypothetical protein